MASVKFRFLCQRSRSQTAVKWKCYLEKVCEICGLAQTFFSTYKCKLSVLRTMYYANLYQCVVFL